MLKLLSAILIVSVFMQSCRESCYCSQVCSYFNRDSIEVCNWNYASGAAFQNTRDSLNNLYPNTERDTFVNPHRYDILGNGAYNNTIKPLINEGEVCPCAK